MAAQVTEAGGSKHSCLGVGPFCIPVSLHSYLSNEMEVGFHDSGPKDQNEFLPPRSLCARAPLIHL